MATNRPAGERFVPAGARVVAGVVVGAVTAAVTAPFAAWQVSALLGWSAAALTFVVLAWSVMLPADAARTRDVAMRLDESRLGADLMVLVAAVASLVGVGFILLKASSEHGAALALLTGLGVLSVLLAWTVVHTIYTLRYADLYYTDEIGSGIDFNDDDKPDYRDFAYLALTIGMTYQVSDTNISEKAIRRTALRHALLSYVFGTVVIAVTINVVASLAR